MKLNLNHRSYCTPVSTAGFGLGVANNQAPEGIRVAIGGRAPGRKVVPGRKGRR
ncbi:hypothetical protein [Pontiella sp.]|uniref:hypothetical protein n=1 Tax=Pontiella sp. TaxID=2837462 RepID=UPI003566A3B1